MKPRGTVLVLVLVVIVLLALAAITFSKLMLAENKGALYSVRQRQVRHLAESGVEFLRVTLMKDPQTLYELGGLYDNEDLFCGYVVTDGTIAMSGSQTGLESGSRGTVDYRDLGRFSVVAPGLSDDGSLYGESIRYGLEDESAKINLRWLAQLETQMPGYGRDLLLRLPGMTGEIADSLLDWLDEDSDPRENGAEDEYYGSLDPPCYTKNGIPDSLDELLLVKGITPTLLYGIDWNRNGVLDRGEPDESTLDNDGGSDGSLNLGLIAYLTLDSRESNINPTTGEPKIDINMSDTSGLAEALAEVLDDQELIDFIVAYREENEKVKTLLDLVDGRVGEGEAAKTSPIVSTDFDTMNSVLPLLYDALTLGEEPVVGRININQAPRGVLQLLITTQEDADAANTANSAQSASRSETTGNANGSGDDGDASEGNAGGESEGEGNEGIPDGVSADSLGGTMGGGTMGGGTGTLSDIPTEEIIEGILAERTLDPALMDDTPEMRYPFWPYTHGIIDDFETMKKLEPYFCTQGSVFKAQVIGRFDEQSPTARLEVWLDATDPRKPAKVLRIRELTDLGGGFPGELLGVEPLQNARSAGLR